MASFFKRSCCTFAGVLVLGSAANAEYALRDGDTVAFLGDSITAARGYSKIVEHYTLMRFPDRRVRFFNAGLGGDTSDESLKRLQSDVFDQGATVVTVAFGINDIGWGMKADAEHKQRYLDGIRTIIEQCKAHGVRPIICSPAITAEAPDTAEKGFLQTMTDEGLALARSLGAQTIDLQRGMREIQRRVVQANEKESDSKKKTCLHVEDGVHLNDLGQLAMAYAMLKGLDAPEDISSCTLDAGKNEPAQTAGCVISQVQLQADGIAFTRLDVGLPLNLGALSGLQYRWIPIPEGINRYMLTIANLPKGDYEIRVGERLIGKANAGQFARGLNLCSMTANGWEPGGPWDAQACVVKELVDARDKLWAGNQVRTRFVPNHPEAAALEETMKKLDDDLVNQQRAMAKPYAYRFTIRRIENADHAGTK